MKQMTRGILLLFLFSTLSIVYGEAPKGDALSPNLPQRAISLWPESISGWTSAPVLDRAEGKGRFINHLRQRRRPHRG
jgi:hypothetical protein